MGLLYKAYEVYNLVDYVLKLYFYALVQQLFVFSTDKEYPAIQEIDDSMYRCENIGKTTL